MLWERDDSSCSDGLSGPRVTNAEAWIILLELTTWQSFQRQAIDGVRVFPKLSARISSHKNELTHDIIRMLHQRTKIAQSLQSSSVCARVPDSVRPGLVVQILYYQDVDGQVFEIHGRRFSLPGRYIIFLIGLDYSCLESVIGLLQLSKKVGRWSPLPHRFKSNRS